MATKSTYPTLQILLLVCLVTLSLISTTFATSSPTPYNSTIVGHNFVITRDLITITIHETKEFKKYIHTIAKLESFNGLTNTTTLEGKTAVTTFDRHACVRELKENLRDMIKILKAIRELRRESLHTCAHALKHKLIRVKVRGKLCKKKLFIHMHEPIFKKLYKKKLKSVVYLGKDVLIHVKKIHPRTLVDLNLDDKDLTNDVDDDDDDDDDDEDLKDHDI